MTKFTNLIKDSYKLSKKGFLIGIVYTPNKTIGFTGIPDEDKLNKILDFKVDMLYLKSNPTDTEIQIYEEDLKNYTIKNSDETLYILTKNGEIGLMY